MGISDLLAMIGGGNLTGGPQAGDVMAAAGGGGDPAAAGGNPGAVAGMLGGNSPDPMMTANGPPPQTISDPLALAPGQPDPSQNMALTQPPSAPVTPPTDHGSVGDFLSHIVQKATAVDPATGMSFADRFGRFAGQMSDLSGATKGATDQWQANMDRNAAAEGRAQLGKMADDLNMSPRERLMFQANPNAWVEANKSRLGYHDQAPNSTGYYGEPGQPGSTQQTAPAPPAPAEDPLTDLKKQAEIDEMKSRRALQDAQAGYYGVKTKQPYAPKAPKALGNGGDWQSRVVGRGSIQ